MVTPVSIKHADLCHGRIPLLGIFEVILDMQEILKGHGKI